MKLKPEIIPDSPEARGMRIKYIRANLLNMKRKDFCEGTTIGIPTLKGWELGLGGGVSKVGAGKVVTKLEKIGIYCSVNWILHGLGQPPQAGTYAKHQSDEEKQIVDELLLFRQQKDAIDSMVVDDGMIPLLYPGNYVAGIISKDTDSCIGKECIIITEHNEKLVRILKQGDLPGKYTLSCINSQSDLVEPHKKNVGIITAAPIIFIRRKNPDKKL